MPREGQRPERTYRTSVMAMDLSEQLRVLEDAQGQPAKLALATVDLVHAGLPHAQRAALEGCPRGRRHSALV